MGTESLVRGPRISVLMLFDYFEPTEFYWTILNFFVKLSHLVMSSREKSQWWLLTMEFFFSVGIVLPLSYPYIVMCSMVCFVI